MLLIISTIFFSLKKHSFCQFVCLTTITRGLEFTWKPQKHNLKEFEFLGRLGRAQCIQGSMGLITDYRHMQLFSPAALPVFLPRTKLCLSEQNPTYWLQSFTSTWTWNSKELQAQTTTVRVQINDANHTLQIQCGQTVSWMNGFVISKGQTAQESLALLPSSLSIFQLLFELAQFLLNRCKEGLQILANLRFDVRWEILVIAQPYIYLTEKHTKKIYCEPLW